jgi:methionyl-tRNA formyltransferase
MKIVYFGTPEFSIIPLKRLLANRGHEILAVVTQPDKPSNRGKKLAFPPLKKFAIERGIKVLQFNKIRKDGAGDLKAIGADIFITCAYGQILSREILDIPKHGVFNIHYSLLPAYRGSSPVQWSLINGETVTGVTIMKTDTGIDNGDIILQKTYAVKDGETCRDVLLNLSDLAQGAIEEALALLESGKIKYIKQDEALATHYPMLKKEDGLIDFKNGSKEIINRIRALNDGSYTYFNGMPLKIYEAKIYESKSAEALNLAENTEYGGVVISGAKDGLAVRCGDSLLEILRLQTPGGRILQAKEFLKGNKLPVGSVFANKSGADD